MKRTFLTILPVAAALLLATSCSKDSDDSNDANDLAPKSSASDTEQTSQPVEETSGKYVAVSFSVKVDNGTSLSKISYSPKDGSQTKVTRAFTSEDINTVLTVASQETGEKAAIEDGTKLTLTSTDNTTFTFEGKINVLKDSVDNFNEGKITLTGTFGAALAGTESSATSLAELMDQCSHQYKATFYSNADNISFVDQNAYLAIQMSPLQHKLLVNGEERRLNSNGQVWVALPSNTTVSTNFLSKNATDVKPGHIYTIDRSGLVDLGLSDGTLWADKNVGATTYDGDGTKLSWNTAMSTVTTPLSLPETGVGKPCKLLVSECTWQWVTSYNGGSRAGLIIFKNGGSDISKDPHIFLPAAGWSNGDGTNTSCVYWTGTPHPRYTNNACRMNLGETGRDVDLNDPKSNTYTVRAVRCK